MKKIRIFHLPVFIAALFGIFLSIALYMIFPGNSLAEYALTLEDGQFICENGYIYEKVKETYSGLVTANRIRHSGCRFTILFGRTPSAKLLPHEYAMQITDRGTVFMDNQGTVWLYEFLHSNARQAHMKQFFPTTPEVDTTAVGKLQINSKTQNLPGMNSVYPSSPDYLNAFAITLPFKAALTSELDTYRKYYQNTSVDLAVRLKDGWHSVKVNRQSTQYSIDPILYNQSIKLINLGHRIYMNTQCRITVYDKNTCKALSQSEFWLTVNDGKAYIKVVG